MAKRVKGKRKKTSKPFLGHFSQFIPDYNVPADYFNSDTFEKRMFPPERNVALRRMLSDRIRGHVVTVQWKGASTGLDRFLEYALIAIATFEYRRKREANFDRGLSVLENVLSRLGKHCKQFLHRRRFRIF